MEPTLRKENDGARFAPATGEAGARRSRFCRNKAQAKLEGLRDLRRHCYCATLTDLGRQGCSLVWHEYGTAPQTRERLKAHLA